MTTKMPAALVLAHLPGITPRRLLHWREAGRTLDEILMAGGDGLWTPAAIRAARDTASREFDQAEARKITFLALDEPEYPELLSQIPDPPLVLRMRGRLAPHRPIAIVGARRADAYGRTMTEMFSRTLARSGSTIVSGLAYGVDAVAHRASLEESGGTIAVLGTGVDVIYPRDHAGLAADILAAGGALLSELPPGAGPQKSHFPRRNRILAALSLGTLVVQAGERSGSLITARLSLDYNRLVWAIPSRIGDPLAAGTLALLREGAFVTTSPAEILADISPLGSPSRQEDAPFPDEPSPGGPLDPLLAAIGAAGATLDELVTATASPRAELLSELLRRELSRQIVSEPGGIYRLTGR